MAPKRIIQSFESFGGVDLSKSALSATPDTFQSLLNMEPAKTAAIRGRRGCQISNHYGNFIAQHGFSFANATTGATNEELFAINDNLFKEVSTSFFIGRVAGALDFSWEILPPDGVTRTTFRFILTQGGAPVTLVNPVTLASNAFLDLGTGLEDTVGSSAQWPVSILDLIQAIDNTANFSVAYPARTARIASIGGAGVFNVQVGHSVNVGDVISVFDTTSTPASFRLVPVKITATTANTLSYDSTNYVFRAEINQTIGNACTPAASIKVEGGQSTTTGAALEVKYSYWQGITTSIGPYRNYIFPFVSAYGAKGTSTTKSSTFYPPTFVDMNGSSYIFTTTANSPAPWEGYVYKYDGQNVYRTGMPEYDSNLTASVLVGGGALSAGNYKYRACYSFYDNRGLLVQGMYKDSNAITAAANDRGSMVLACVQTNAQVNTGLITTAAAATNTIRINSSFLVPKISDYLYIYDSAQQEMVTRQVSNVIAATATEHDVTFIGAVITVGVGFIFNINPDFGYNLSGACVNGNQTNVGNTSGVLLTVYNNALSGGFRTYNTLRVGDTVRLYNSLSQVYETRTLSVVNPTSIGWDSGAPVNVASDTPISCNLCISVYRTKVNGSKFYKVADYPNANYADFVSFVDGRRDDLLVEEFIEPAIGKEPNPPPRASIGCSHQGKLVFGRIMGEPNTVAWSDDVGGPETVPLASNYLDLPPTIGGPITAMGSDLDNKLAVFKDNAYYDLDGDLEAGSITVLGTKEGDYGVASQASLVKVNGVLLGVGKLGVVAVARGQMISDSGSLGSNAWTTDSQGAFGQLGGRIYATIVNNANLAYSQAVAINDRSNRTYNFYIPSTEIYTKNCSPSSVQTFTYPVSFIWDYGHRFGWFDREYACFGVEPSGGFAIYNNETRFLSCSLGSPISLYSRGVPFRFFPESVTATKAAADNHYYVRKQIMTYPLAANDVSFDSQYQQIKLFRFPSTLEVADLTAFVMRLQTYRNYQTSTVDSTRTFSFTGNVANIEVFNNLNSGKARAMLFLWSCTYDFSQNIQQIPYISGYEIITDVDYAREDYHD